MTSYNLVNEYCEKFNISDLAGDLSSTEQTFIHFFVGANVISMYKPHFKCNNMYTTIIKIDWVNSDGDFYCSIHNDSIVFGMNDNTLKININDGCYYYMNTEISWPYIYTWTLENNNNNYYSFAYSQ